MTTRPGSSVCVLLDCPVTHDGRVQRTVRTLSRRGPVLLVTSGGSADDRHLFNDRVEVRPMRRRRASGLRRWLLLHRQHDQLADEVLRDGRRVDVVWANDYSTLFPAVRIARATGAKLVYDAHEIWLETVNQFFPTDVALIKRLAFRAIIAVCRAIGKREERRLVRSADVVITVSDSVAQALSKALGRADVGVVLNTPERKALRSSDRIRRELELAPGDHIVLYQGSMTPGRGLHELVASFGHLPEDVRLVMLGDGVLAGSLRRTARQAGLEGRVFFPGVLPQVELHEWTASADLGVLILEPINLSKRYALANKVFEYMAAGIPILATDLPENRRIVCQCHCGWLTTTWTPQVLAEHISSIIARPSEMQRRGLNGRRWFEERYNWGVESARLVAMIEDLTAPTEIVM